MPSSSENLKNIHGDLTLTLTMMVRNSPPYWEVGVRLFYLNYLRFVQFSILIPGSRPRCLTLSVTITIPFAIAVEPIRMSKSSILLPSFSSFALKSLQSFCFHGSLLLHPLRKRHHPMHRLYLQRNDHHHSSYL